ncbi:hypothetical protein ZIOFF_033000 [Zingiber officinale]|uniref:VQ domain-containing protein n=1 Tax=Zingiber officinale TaxID=94328 RepID=A0A8J5L1K4_ZINOF|nr:hypothetical protein ZIOFF_033000 [Zingiber officinale]
MTNDPSGSTSRSVVPASQAPPAAPLRIIRMPASKPWRRPERPQLQVFRVHRAGFRELVQRLTGAPPTNAPPPHPSEPVIEAGPAAPLPPGPPVAIGDRLQTYVEEEGRRFGEEHQYVWPSPADPAAGDWRFQGH